ncbi:cytochrome P450 [Pseudohaliea rubra]|nr:cytochrome P450 [Pseudohaliea rubra]
MTDYRVDSFQAAARTLRNMDLRQALYDEGGILMERVLVNLHGDEHRNRRAVESQLFRKNFFRLYESEIFPALLEETLDQFLVEDALDLKALGYRIMVHVSLAFAGIDRVDSSVEEADTLHRLLIHLGQAATIGQYHGDRAGIMQEILSAMEEFDRRFFQPSRARRVSLLERFADGSLEEAELPRDILTVLLMNDDMVQLPDEILMKEVAFFYLAASHTSVHSLVHATNELFTWFRARGGSPQELLAEPRILQRFVHESLRLHPSSPESWRRATCPLEVPGQGEVAEGSKVVIDLQRANRDRSVFGNDADCFNPYRERPPQVSPAGLSFGGGMHVCLGMNLVAGTILRSDDQYDPENHQYGTLAIIIGELLGRGMRPDPERPPRKIEASERDVWAEYPVRFDGASAA